MSQQFISSNLDIQLKIYHTGNKLVIYNVELWSNSSAYFRPSGFNLLWTCCFSDDVWLLLILYIMVCVSLSNPFERRNMQYCSNMRISVKSLYFCRFVLAFSLGAGPVPGLLLGEIFPNRIRAKAMAICMCVHWVSTSQFDHIYWVCLSMKNLPSLFLEQICASFSKPPYSGAAAWLDFRFCCCMIFSLAWKVKFQTLRDAF